MPLAALESASYLGLPLMALGYVAIFALLLQRRAQWLNLLAIGISLFLLAFSHAWLRWSRYGRESRMWREQPAAVIG